MAGCGGPRRRRPGCLWSPGWFTCRWKPCMRRGRRSCLRSRRPNSTRLPSGPVAANSIGHGLQTRSSLSRPAASIRPWTCRFWDRRRRGRGGPSRPSRLSSLTRASRDDRRRAVTARVRKRRRIQRDAVRAGRLLLEVQQHARRRVPGQLRRDGPDEIIVGECGWRSGQDELDKQHQPNLPATYEKLCVTPADSFCHLDHGRNQIGA